MGAAEKTYRQGRCPHCGATIEMRSYDLDDGETVFGAIPGRKTVHRTTIKLDGTSVCEEVAK
jgi:hypothetical protein